MTRLLPTPMRQYFLLLGLLFAGRLPLQAQSLDLDHLLHYKDQYVRVGGGLSLSSVYTYADDPQVLQQPFTYVVGGNVNVQVATFALPFSFSYTNQQLSYTHPFRFNRLSIHPKYKWVTAHAGDCALSFSPYSLNGMLFTGGGVELAPPRTHLRLTALYGRFLKATEADSFNIPAYARWGWGAKADYEQERYKLGLSVFHAKDRVGSIAAPADFRALYPQENLVLDGTVNATLAKWLTLDGEYAVSTLTRDLRYADGPAEGASFPGKLMQGNSSTVRYHALKGGVTAVVDKAQLRLGYERIDPDYTTLGAYYFTNDLENITLSLSRPFLKNRLNIALTGGAQRDDLNGARVRASKRFVGSAAVTYQAGERLSLNGQFSTFQSYSNMRSQFDYINSASTINPADTLSFAQVSRNASANLAWTVRKSETSLQLLTANLCWQDAADKEGDRVRAGGGSTLVNTALAYTVQHPKAGLGLTAALNGTYNTVGTADMYLVGPAAGITKAFRKTGIRTGLSVAYNNAFAGGASTGDVWNLRGNAAYTFQKKHQLSLSLTGQLRKTAGGLQPGRRTQLLIASFNYAFAL